MTYVFLDSGSEVLRSMATLFRISPSTDSRSRRETMSDVPPTDMKRKILTHIFEVEFDISSSSSSSDDPLGLRLVPSDRLDDFYRRALSICENALYLPCDGCGGASGSFESTGASPIAGGLSKLYREAYLTELLREIQPDTEFLPRRSRPFDPANAARASQRNSITLGVEELARAALESSDTERQHPRTGSSGGVIEPAVQSMIEASVNSAVASVRSLVQPPSASSDSSPFEDSIPCSASLSFGQRAPAVPDIVFTAVELGPGASILFFLSPLSLSLSLFALL
jgi:hypothetical protein